MIFSVLRHSIAFTSEELPGVSIHHHRQVKNTAPCSSFDITEVHNNSETQQKQEEKSVSSWKWLSKFVVFPFSSAVPHQQQLRRPPSSTTSRQSQDKMIKLFSLKQQKKDGEATPKSGPQKKAFTAAQLRITKDINELNLPKTCATEFPDPDDLLNFKMNICPDEGFYKGGRFDFTFKVGQNYPHEPPKVKCETQVYHPNIDLEGNVCLNILREDWKPVLTINSIVYGLQYLFLEPNPEDPLNREAAEVLQTNRRLFEHNVYKAMRGSYIGETYFERCLK